MSPLLLAAALLGADPAPADPPQAGPRLRRRRGEAARGLGRPRPRGQDRGGRPGRRGEGPGRRPRHRAAGHDAAAGADRRPHAPAAAPVQRGAVGRPGAQGAARPARLPGDQPRARARCWPASPRSATWAPRGPGTPTSGIKQAIDQGIMPGPRMLVTTRAIVATGSYAPRGFAPEWRIPQGAEEADGDGLVPRRPRPDRPGGRLDQGLRRHRARATAASGRRSRSTS